MADRWLFAYVDGGTKVSVLDKDVATAKVRILEGAFAGIECWTIIEAVKER